MGCHYAARCHRMSLKFPLVRASRSSSSLLTHSWALDSVQSWGSYVRTRCRWRRGLGLDDAIDCDPRYPGQCGRDTLRPRVSGPWTGAAAGQTWPGLCGHRPVRGYLLAWSQTKQEAVS
jgi:hypothetical protein